MDTAFDIALSDVVLASSDDVSTPVTVLCSGLVSMVVKLATLPTQSLLENVQVEHRSADSEKLFSDREHLLIDESYPKPRHLGSEEQLTLHSVKFATKLAYASSDVLYAPKSVYVFGQSVKK